MTLDEFWDVIEDARMRAKGDAENMGRLVQKRLETMNGEEIISFEDQFQGVMRKAYSFRLMVAAFILMSHISDDTFEEFRAWLVMLGRTTFEDVLRDPEKICELLERGEVEKISGEALILAAEDAYSSATAREDFYDRIAPFSNARVEMPWPDTKEELRELAPALFDKFWNQEKVRALHQGRDCAATEDS